MKNPTANKVLAILIAIILVAGWFFTLKGIPGHMDPWKDKINLGLDIKGGVYVVLEAQDTGKYSDEELADLMEQTKAVVENRVDQMGLANPNVSVEGKNRIRVELPGVEDSNEAIDQIGRTAQLKFTMADNGFVLDGSSVDDATSQQATETGKSGYEVDLEFNSEGADAFAKATETALAGTVEPTVTSDQCQDGGEVNADQILIWLDNTVISHPQVNEVISGGRCQITGNFSQEEASTLAALIRGGSLPLDLEEIQSSSQTATIGQNAMNTSVKAGIIGLICVFVLMLLVYRMIGLVADLVLCLYLFLILGGMALTGSVLTLPGIAGIILTIGMAVDGNVVIFARIREEIASGKGIRVATQTGYRRALTTVIDAQITTLIAAVILYQIGTSSVRGFAWTLMIGTICSIITAVFVTQIYLNLMAASPAFAKPGFFGIKKNGDLTLAVKRRIPVIEHRRKFYAISIIVIIVGGIFMGVRGMNYGIDFTGGTMLHLDMGKKVTTADVEKVMSQQDGINTKQMQVVFSGDGNKEVIIRTNESLDQNKRQEVIDALTTEFGLSEDSVLESENFGASVGNELKKNAVKAVLLAALGMLIYIRLRFRQWKFGAAALLGVLHDVLVLIAFYAIFRVTVNNPFIAAVLTVVGYSINDTIVIFDRVRENNKMLRKGNTVEILDTSISQTLSRSIMTSLSTVIVMVPLLAWGSDAIREFTLPLMVGVIAGTYSSIFTCSPLYYEFTKLTKKKGYQGKKKKSSYQGIVKDKDVEDEKLLEQAERDLEADIKRMKEEMRPQTPKEAGKGHRKPSRAERKKGQ